MNHLDELAGIDVHRVRTLRATAVAQPASDRSAFSGLFRSLIGRASLGASCVGSAAQETQRPGGSAST